MTRLKSAREEGLKEGLKEATIKNVENFLLMGLDVNMVAKGTGLSLKEVEDIKIKLASTVNSNHSQFINIKN